MSVSFSVARASPTLQIPAHYDLRTYWRDELESDKSVGARVSIGHYGRVQDHTHWLSLKLK